MATHLFLGRFLFITLVILFGLVGVAQAGHFQTHPEAAPLLAEAAPQASGDAIWRKKTAAKLKTLLSKHHLPCAIELGPT